ncbi:uncharacterized protein LOC136074940 isoform X2 [Hydra vulgaris]|uniref:Uncharacterized protein LOC136074940 isoform X2 n=1 Tax=Hydra vulgaris TaxID=6087 RepID=A0ABM4B339_HYDVU
MADKEFQKLEDENQKKGVLGNPRKNLLFGCCQGNALLSSFMEDTSACIIGIFVVILTLYIGLFVSMITIGALAKDKCQIEPMIPIYLIVVGVTGIALAMCGCLKPIHIEINVTRRRIIWLFGLLFYLI